MSHAFVRIEMSHSSREFHSERCYSLIAVMKGGQQSMNDKNNLGERFFFREATTSRYRSKLFLIYFFLSFDITFFFTYEDNYSDGNSYNK